LVFRRPAAIKAAYPRARASVLSKYVQDSICGTWEMLADAVLTGGSKALKKMDGLRLAKSSTSGRERLGRTWIWTGMRRRASENFATDCARWPTRERENANSIEAMNLNRATGFARSLAPAVKNTNKNILAKFGQGFSRSSARLSTLSADRVSPGRDASDPPARRRDPLRRS